MMKKTLTDLIKAYEVSQEPQKYDLIIENFYIPKRKKLENTRERNEKLLEKYAHYRNGNVGQESKYVPIWQDEEELYFADMQSRTFGKIQRHQVECEADEQVVAAIVNAMWENDIWKIGDCFRLKSPFLDAEYPVYLIYDSKYWDIWIQINDLESLLKEDCFVFLVGEAGLRNYMEEDMVILPNRIWGDPDQRDRYSQIISGIYEKKQAVRLECETKIAQYYREHADDIWTRVKEKKPKIFFVTSRFSTAVQFHTQNCMESIEKMGLQVVLFIEPDRLHRTFDSDLIKKIWEEKPDIFFMIDHLRCEKPWLPKEIFFVSWFQDPLGTIFDKKTPEKLGERDYCLNHYTTWKKFHLVGYDKKYLIDAPIPANQNVYRPYRLSEKEKQDYECDICLVCHDSNANSCMDGILSEYPEELRDILREVFKTYHRYAYHSGKIFYGEDQFRIYVNAAFQEIFGNTDGWSSLIDRVVYDMYNIYNCKVFRQVLVDWVLDAGVTNVKLWGSGWQTEEKYKKYAMGPAKNGETLSKIYQASKIVLGNNVLTTAAARAWEAMQSGAFYMSNYIPEESDCVDIRKIIDVDKDVIMFYDRDDLIRKLHYYLEHEDERKKWRSADEKQL
jgi:hypothetical protein